MRACAGRWGIGIALCVLGLSRSLSAASGDLDHRDDFRMDSISGGNFRDYIVEHIAEDDAWAYSMRTFGSFHNFMHEMMSAMARHGALERGDVERVPPFVHRISGGDWRAYREALEAAEEVSTWTELVQITEIMHDRVHHAMVKSLLHDNHAQQRGIELDGYLRDAPLPEEVGIPAPEEVDFDEISLDAFREFVWRHQAEGPYEHGMLQQMVVFGHMLDDLLAQWLLVGLGQPAAACRPPPEVLAFRGRGWPAYVERVARCEDAYWREHVQVVGLMRGRIHHMFHKMVQYSQ